jgi:hypothetical protein
VADRPDVADICLAAYRNYHQNINVYKTEGLPPLISMHAAHDASVTLDACLPSLLCTSQACESGRAFRQGPQFCAKSECSHNEEDVVCDGPAHRRSRTVQTAAGRVPDVVLDP